MNFRVSSRCVVLVLGLLVAGLLHANGFSDENQYDTRIKTQQETSTSTITDGQESRIWNLRNVDIRNIVAEVSRETGKNFILDPKVQGKLTIISTTPMSSDQVYSVFLSGLQVLGYSAVPSGSVIKIMPSVNARESGSPVVDQTQSRPTDDLVVRVIPLQHVSAQKLIPNLRPLLPQWANLSAYTPSNMLIASGGAGSIERLAEIVTRVDTPENSGIEIMPLRNALATDIVDTLNNLQGRQTNLDADTRIAIAADDRSNSVLLKGPPANRLRMRVIIAELDSASPDGGDSNTQVIYLRFQKAKDIVSVLAGVAQSNYSGKVTTTIGTSSLPVVQPGGRINASQASSGLLGQEQNIQPIGMEQGGQAGSTQSSGEGKSRVEIIAEPNTNAIIISAPPNLMRTLKNVINKIDIRPAQVLVEALVAEINEDETNSLGIQWGSVATEDSGLGTLGFQQGVGIIRKGAFDEFQAVVRALGRQNKADILSTPSLVVLDNHQAKIEVGKQVSIEESNYPNNAGGTTASGSPFTTFSRENISLHLIVTPQISQNNSVNLDIDHANNTLQNPNIPTTKPVVNTSSIITSVLVESGDILVLGGLIQNEIQHSEEAIPIASKVPIIGGLFKNTAKTRTKRNLMIFIRPVIMKDSLANDFVSGGKYNYMRAEQLKWFQDMPYQTADKEFILAPYEKRPELPRPFPTRL